MPKKYLKALVIILLVFVNYFALKYSFEGMTYPNDFTFIAGILGLFVTVSADIIIIKRIRRKKDEKSNTAVA